MQAPFCLDFVSSDVLTVTIPREFWSGPAALYLGTILLSVYVIDLWDFSQPSVQLSRAPDTKWKDLFDLDFDVISSIDDFSLNLHGKLLC